MDQEVKSGSGRFILSTLQDSSNVSLHYREELVHLLMFPVWFTLGGLTIRYSFVCLGAISICHK